jgi:hypothetical protein
MIKIKGHLYSIQLSQTMDALCIVSRIGPLILTLKLNEKNGSEVANEWKDDEQLQQLPFPTRDPALIP